MPLGWYLVNSPARTFLGGALVEAVSQNAAQGVGALPKKETRERNRGLRLRSVAERL